MYNVLFPTQVMHQSRWISQDPSDRPKDFWQKMSCQNPHAAMNFESESHPKKIFLILMSELYQKVLLLSRSPWYGQTDYCQNHVGCLWAFTFTGTLIKCFFSIVESVYVNLQGDPFIYPRDLTSHPHRYTGAFWLLLSKVTKDSDSCFPR